MSPAAINKEGVGDIDFVWGETGAETGTEGYGLAHIIERRNKDGFNGESFIKQIPEIIKNGEIINNQKALGRVFIKYDKDKAVIRLTWNNEDRVWLVTAFKEYLKKP